MPQACLCPQTAYGLRNELHHTVQLQMEMPGMLSFPKVSKVSKPGSNFLADTQSARRRPAACATGFSTRCSCRWRGPACGWC